MEDEYVELRSAAISQNPLTFVYKKGDENAIVLLQPETEEEMREFQEILEAKKRMGRILVRKGGAVYRELVKDGVIRESTQLCQSD